MPDEKRMGEMSDLASVMSTDHGRRVMRRVLAYCGTFRSVMFGPGGDWEPQKSEWRAGMQDVGHWLTTELQEAHPGGFQAMFLEHYQKVMEAARAKKEKKSTDKEETNENPV